MFSVICVVAGLLRVTSGLIDFGSVSDYGELIYIAIDLGFILSLMGIYSTCRTKLNWLGHAGFMVSVCGFGLIAGPEATLNGVDVYQIGSPIIGLGTLMLSIALIRNKLFGVIAPALLISSVVIGVGAMFVFEALLFAAAGVLFGIGFMILGARLWSK